MYFQKILEGKTHYSKTCNQLPAGRKWSDIELKALSHFYPISTKKELINLFDRSANSIYLKANILKLAKNQDVILAQTSFKKGYTPFNKGRKMEEWLSPDVHNKIKQNQARTADRNRANAYPDGHVSKRKDGYFTKVNGKWISNAILSWQKHKGQIPDGHCIIHRAGVYDDRIENLALVLKNNAAEVLKSKCDIERKYISQKSGQTRKNKRQKLFRELAAAQNRIG